MCVDFLPPKLTKSTQGIGRLASPGLRQSFLNGALTRVLDPDRVPRGKIFECGDLGLATGANPTELTSTSGTGSPFPRTRSHSKARSSWSRRPRLERSRKWRPKMFPKRRKKEQASQLVPEHELAKALGERPAHPSETRTLRLSGTVPPEVWNRLEKKFSPSCGQESI